MNQRDIFSDKSYVALTELLSKKFNVSYKSTHGYNYNTYYSSVPNYFFIKNKFIISLIFLLLPFVLLLIIFKPNKRNKISFDVAFEEWKEDTYSSYYEGIIHFLSKNISKVRVLSNKSEDNCINDNDYVDKVILIKVSMILFLNPMILYHLLKIQLKYKSNNILFVYIKLLLAYIKYKSLAKNVNTKVYVSANDINSFLLKYEIFSEFNIKYILIQSSLRSKSLLKYKGSDVVYCFGEIQSKLYKDKTNEFKKILTVGSIKNTNVSTQNFEKEYDILFVEIYGDMDVPQYSSNNNYIKILEHFVRFSNEFPQYKLTYRTRAERRGQRKQFTIFNEILDKVEKSNITIDSSGCSYEAVKKSKLVIGYYSALCFESIGLDVPSLFFYYDKYDFELYDFDNGNDILIVNDGYKEFKNSLLLGLNEDKEEYFKKYKPLYMDQCTNIPKDIAIGIMNSFKTNY